MIKNLPAVLAALDFQIERVGKLHIAAFRKAVWEVFCNILVQTPQFTGRAVANWNIGVGAPDLTFDPAGDDQRVTKSGYLAKGKSLRQRGDHYWIDYAKEKNRPRLFLIKGSTKVFISNAARGDTDNGKSSEMYLESLQDPAYWMQKLRDVNKPYETAAETLILFNMRRLDLGELEPFL